MGASLPAGILSDRRGRRVAFAAGLVFFALAYAGFATANRGFQVWPLFAVYGLYIALTDGVGKALITDLAPAERRATALGAYGMVTGVAALLASVVAGLLWDQIGVSAPFILGAAAAPMAVFHSGHHVHPGKRPALGGTLCQSPKRALGHGIRAKSRRPLPQRDPAGRLEPSRRSPEPAPHHQRWATVHPSDRRQRLSGGGARSSVAQDPGLLGVRYGTD